MRECGKFSQLACALPDYVVVLVEGSDATKFLQGQLTCDVIKLADKCSTLAAHCDPKGKVNSLFRLVKFNPEQFWLILERSFLPSAINFLKKYAVFSKVTFTPLEQKYLYAFSLHRFTEIATEIDFSVNSVISLSSEQVTIKVDQANPYVLVVSNHLVDVNGEQVEWQLLAMQNGQPLLTLDNQAEFLPQAINLQCLEATISFSKGCYIGQEMVARAKYRGANKRAMFTLVSEQNTGLALPKIGDGIELKLETGWRKTGVIISSIQIEERVWLQVVLNQDIESEAIFRLSEQEEAKFIIAPLPYLITE
ncbi:tRNA-modifying protein YgfZ [Mergibacter septicus]|uniref:tRNA-modifying protein YgfZ n=1 Tax=Mergibacter septicus TaxID=221402 RepID=A0A8E3SAA5_9PAST|nr:tRNA-modifying protein YgfZ [Mergibacter septicus]AWX15871.1 tRNA-modifying protein YgfZ [Mergibacter septicus]QDJ15124.1 tRNA-modifying protein YgfZ [Mergibacter septicus]UTU47452.1 tRNA-modifying protein YgfZ [Mergibacter septicus]WMR95367.1 tRNA-modifying protein YgfZ [Mergibacter septicus]